VVHLIASHQRGRPRALPPERAVLLSAVGAPAETQEASPEPGGHPRQDVGGGARCGWIRHDVTWWVGKGAVPGPFPPSANQGVHRPVGERDEPGWLIRRDT